MTEAFDAQTAYRKMLAGYCQQFPEQLRGMGRVFQLIEGAAARGEIYVRVPYLGLGPPDAGQYFAEVQALKVLGYRVVTNGYVQLSGEQRFYTVGWLPEHPSRDFLTEDLRDTVNGS